MTQEIERLAQLFKPNNYNILLDIDPDNLKFNGVCKINGIKLTSDQAIKLHSKDLKINTVKINNQAVKFTIKEDLLEISDSSQKDADLDIYIEYSAAITKAMHGIYPSTTKNGNKIISTQFESHHAREAFPCIDEPEAKATFDFSVKYPGGMTALGNMPANSTTQEEDSKITVFETSPIMSTYLLAFAVGELQSIKTKTNKGIDVAVWSSLDHNKESLEFALDVTAKSLDFLEDYFGVEYPLPKLDQLALPDFSSGAMENWGLVTYREIALLVDPKNASTSSKEMVALVIAHELSHQWFGNLVTMQWWDDLWLNESFATLMEYIVIDNLFPQWNVMLTFASHEALLAFRRDILDGVQAVATEVHHPDEISTLFDPSIVYAKGARLLWMVYNLVGEANFKLGLKNYFNTYKYKNTIGNNLWEALGQASGIDVSSIMEKWLKQPGLPYIEIDEEPGGQIEINQYKLTSTGPSNHSLWPIPLWTDQPISEEVLEAKSNVFKAEKPNVRFNTVGGHYVCLYKNHEVRELIRQQIAKNSVDPVGRLLFLNDAMLLSKCSVTPIHQMLDTVKSYKTEDQESIWGVISLAISDIKMLAEGDDEAEVQLKQFVFNLIEDKYNQLGWESRPEDSANDIKLRTTIIGLSVYSERASVISTALDLYKKHKIHGLDSDIRGSVLVAVAKNSDDSTYQQLLQNYPEENIADIKMDICTALCASKNEANLKTLIAKLKDEQFVKLQDIDRFLVYLLRNKTARPLAWQWLVDNWQWIEQNFASDKSYDSYPRYAAGAFSNEFWLAKFKDHFLPLKDHPALTRNIEIGVKDIENKIAWRNKEQADLITWLKVNI